MTIVPSISTIIQVAIISQYKCTQDILTSNFSGGQVLNKTLPNLLRTLRKCVQNTFSVNPNDPALLKTSQYVFALCAPYSQYALGVLARQGQAIPVITGPSNQSVNVGQNATFSVSVVSSIPVTYQWYDTLGNIIVGATGSTYTVTNAQLSQSGSTFFVKVTNSAGSAVSDTATLTVIQNIVGYLYQGNTDYSTDLLAGTDDVVYLGTFPITHGQPLSVTFPHLGASEFIVVKYPVSESVKTSYINPPPSGPDAGGIPSLALEANSFGGWQYIFSRGGNPFVLNSVNGQVKFS